MAIEWTPKLAVNVPRIDEQHQELFRRVNALLAAMKEGQGRGELAPLVTFLGDYVHEHFGAEAKVMVSSRYPAIDAHLREHAGFVKDYQQLSGALLADGPDAHLVVKSSRLLCDWLRAHVSTSDRALGEHLRARNLADAM